MSNAARLSYQLPRRESNIQIRYGTAQPVWSWISWKTATPGSPRLNERRTRSCILLRR